MHATTKQPRNPNVRIRLWPRRARLFGSERETQILHRATILAVGYVSVSAHLRIGYVSHYIIRIIKYLWNKHLYWITVVFNLLLDLFLVSVWRITLSHAANRICYFCDRYSGGCFTCCYCSLHTLRAACQCEIWTFLASAHSICRALSVCGGWSIFPLTNYALNWKYCLHRDW